MKNIFIKEKKSKMEILKLQGLKEEKKFFQRLGSFLKFQEQKSIFQLGEKMSRKLF